jgi:hypothetical protein
MTPSRFHDVEAVRHRYGDELVDTFMRAVMLSDQPGDRLVTAFRTLPGGAGWRMLDQAIDGEADPQAPPELQQLLRPVLDPPDWVDFDLVDAGAVAYWKAGSLSQLIAQTAGSLAYGYGSASLARPLARTGRLTQMAPRRLAETARWTLAATRPGAMRPGGEGLHATLRLRLVHALIRAHLRSDWDEANWGVPISVGDTVATGMIGFFIYPMRGLEDLGIRYSEAEREALTHLWAWITFVMGAPEEYLPLTYAEAAEWAEAGMALDSGGIEESPALMRALLFRGLVYDRVLPGPAAALARQASGHLLGACARRWMGDERADVLEIPDTPLKHLVPLVRPAARARSIAGGLLGGRRLAALELALAERTMAAVKAPRTQIQPEWVERQPVLPAAAAQ